MVDISLYFHIPFCTKKCDYCHFYVIPERESSKEALLEGLRLEWGMWASFLQDKNVVSIYFGGGTPSLFGPKYISEILSWIKVDQDVEITLEANPENLKPELLTAYRNSGINRLSIGVQTFNDHLLKSIGRTHDARKAIEGVENGFSCGFKNISIDLMYDLPDQTLAMWKESVDIAVKLPITHLSLYNLTIEPTTLFYKKKKEIEKRVPDEESSLHMYLYAVKALEESGFHHYEISAFAKEGYESRHNSGYWTGRPFLGFGPSAFSYLEKKRFRNVCNLNKYLSLLKAHQSPIDFEEKLEGDAHQNELLAIHLRLLKGVPISLFEKENGPLSKKTKNILQKLVQDGFLQFERDTYSLTNKGILFYDTVAVEII